jgi:hypothetical protein
VKSEPDTSQRVVGLRLSAGAEYSNSLYTRAATYITLLTTRIKPSHPYSYKTGFEGLASAMRYIARQGLMTKMMAVNNSYPFGA